MLKRCMGMGAATDGSGARTATQNQQQAVDLSAVRADLSKALHDTTHDDGSLAPQLLRFAWHACGTYDAATNTGGSNGGTIWLPIEAADPENKGFDKARKLLTTIHHKHRSTLSRADTTVLAGCVAIEASGGPRIPCAIGRADLSEAEAHCPFGDGQFNPCGSRLPAADLGPAVGCPLGAPAVQREQPTIDAVRGTFRRMGFDDRETVCLIVLGHQYGRCHPEVSGYEFPWYSFEPSR